MDKIQKLSQAIRLGSTFRPKAIKRFFDNGASCAQGAAFEAITGEMIFPYNYADKLRIIKTLQERFNVSIELLNEVAYRNNGTNGYVEQTREEIAVWLEQQGL